jgi:ATP-binding cassette subfamily F protein uup
MILVDIHGARMSRPGRVLFDDVSMTVSTGDRLGVVGINGSGKSTLLSILTGAAQPEAGIVRRGRDITVASVSQVTVLPPGTVREVVGEGWRGESVLDRLGLGELLDTPTSRLSGGEEKRVALARALVNDADLLVLDEPTNHLDVDAIEWLEHHLESFRGGLVLVTHDRHLLDRVATRIIELDKGEVHVHAGGYAGYLEGRAEREAREAAAGATRRNLARRELAWLRRGAPARTRKSKARVSSATALVASRDPAPVRSGDLDLAALHEETPRLGDQVVELHGVDIGHQGRPLLISGLDLLVDRRERLGVVGANGSGKSTLLDVIAGRRAPSAGRVIIGPTARIGLHDQMGRDLDPSTRVRDAVAGGNEPSWWHTALLERFWFDADAQWAPIQLLSGGERRRLQLVLTLAERPNVLLLDEPTNDLDLDTLRALEDFLDGWPGALLAVSHDRAFLERTVEDVIVLDGRGRAGRWPGGHEAWLRHRREGGAPSTALPPSSGDDHGRRQPPPTGPSASTLRHRLGMLEEEMARLEDEIAELGGQIEMAGGDHLRLAELTRDLARAEAELTEAEERWLALADSLERTGRGR